MLQQLEEIALTTTMLECDDIPAMGNLMNLLTALKENAADATEAPFCHVIEGIIIYLEKLILSESEDVAPIEEGVTILQSMYRAYERGEPVTLPQDSLFNKITVPEASAEAGKKKIETAVMADEASDAELPGKAPGHIAWAPDEIEILKDFVLEARDNIESIEMNLVALEDLPDDPDTINVIFRPFHTIKGVSGFLNLDKINRLSHSAENLLDMARNGKVHTDKNFIEVLLEAVDKVKNLIDDVEAGIGEGGMLEIVDTRLEDLIDRLNRHAKEGGKPAERLGEMLKAQGDIAPEKLENCLAIQQNEPDKKIGEIIVEQGLASKETIDTALKKQKEKKATFAQHQVKVDIQKLDNLMDLTGELVISHAMLKENPTIRSSTDNHLCKNLNQLSQIVSGLQHTAMAMRMVPIKTTFQKMVRLVRDLSGNAGKKVALHMSGEDTEIDRNVVDALYEPLVHMIRNAVDHGLEIPDERTSGGKPETGNIYLNAYHKSGHIVIEIRDDGRGLNKDRIREKAVASGLTSGHETLTDNEIFHFIFHPGFSTAQTVSDVSGRGVGMDVVKQGIEKLRGRLEIESTPMQGTCFTLNLPLTLAIIEGMIVRVGVERYIIPMLSIMESFRPSPDHLHSVEGKAEIVQTRGRLIPLLRLGELLDTTADIQNPCEGLVVVVEHSGKQKGLLIDELLGKEEVVSKSLGGALSSIPGVSGGAILPDGRIGLILDIESLFQLSDTSAGPNLRSIRQTDDKNEETDI